MWSIKTIKSCNGYKVRVIIDNGKITKEVVGKLPGLIGLQYDLQLRAIYDDEFYIEGINNIQAKPVSMRNCKAMAQYLKKKHRIQGNLSDICKAIVKGEAYPAPEVVEPHLRAYKNKDLHLCFVAGHTPYNFTSTIARQLREHPESLCLRDLYETPYAYSARFTVEDINRVRAFLEREPLSAEESARIHRIKEQIQHGPSKFPKDTEGMQKLSSGLWVFSMDLTRYNTLRERMKNATVYIGSMTRTHVEGCTHVIVPHQDDVRDTLRNTGSAVRPKVYYPSYKWKDSDTVCIMHAERFTSVQWAMICASAHPNTTIRMVGRNDVGSRNPFAKLVKEVEPIYCPKRWPQKILVWRKGLHACVDMCLKEFGEENIQIFGTSRDILRKRVWVSGPRRIRTIKRKTSQVVFFHEEDGYKYTRYLGDDAVAIQPYQWPAGMVDCSIVITDECKFNAQFAESISRKAVYYIGGGPTEVIFD